MVIWLRVPLPLLKPACADVSTNRQTDGPTEEQQRKIDEGPCDKIRLMGPAPCDRRNDVLVSGHHISLVLCRENTLDFAISERNVAVCVLKKKLSRFEGIAIACTVFPKTGTRRTLNSSKTFSAELIFRLHTFY